MITIQIYDKNHPVYGGQLDGPLELGRQQAPAERLFSRSDGLVPPRIAIARLSESSISRKHLQLEPIASGYVRVRNLSETNPVQIGGGGLIAARGSCELLVPVRLIVGNKTIDVQQGEESEASDLESLDHRTMLPGDVQAAKAACSAALSSLADPETEKLLGWMQAVTTVLHSAAGSADFFDRAAQCLVDLVHLDCGRVLLWQNGEWKIAALRSCSSEDTVWRSSNWILSKVFREKQTFWMTPQSMMEDSASLAEIQAVVAAPICDRSGAVIGVLYGDRTHAPRVGEIPRITRLEAMLVEVLACSVAAGLARIEQEKVALAAQVRFEQFFSPELSRQLTAEPDLLRGRDCEVSVLFCDIRSFSRISERLGPAKTVDWIGSVLSMLSDCVVNHGGVLVDYVGDELMAMWGAPVEQANHAERACRAALAMYQALPELSARWEAVLGEPIRIGVGINSGLARVGNTGSHRKFKYGPLGNTVNLASRVEGATKHLKANALITGDTRKRLPADLAVRRLCTVRVVNIQEPVDLYELCVGDAPQWKSLRRDYEAALGQFQHQQFLRATHTLGNILAEHPDDGPSLVLLSRAVNELIRPQSPFDAIWELGGK